MSPASPTVPPATSTAPIRRSPLEAIHAALGATWRFERMPWPESYGDLAAERRILETGIGLAEPGPFDKLVVRGSGALTAARSLGFTARPGTLIPLQAAGVNVWSLADDEAILVLPGWTTDGSPNLAGTADLAARLRAAGATVTDISSGLTVLRLIGPQVRDLLEELCAIDLAPMALPDLAIAQLTVASCRVILARRDHGQLPGFTLLVGRDDAEALWDVLVELGRPHGLAPVGTAAIVPPVAAGS
jgi:aminomethyltransferase